VKDTGIGIPRARTTKVFAAVAPRGGRALAARPWNRLGLAFVARYVELSSPRAAHELGTSAGDAGSLASASARLPGETLTPLG